MKTVFKGLALTAAWISLIQQMYVFLVMAVRDDFGLTYRAIVVVMIIGTLTAMYALTRYVFPATRQDVMDEPFEVTGTGHRA